MSAKKENQEQRSIQETFNELDQLIKEMESSETSLEKSFELYKKGKELIDFCDKSIADIESEVSILEE